MTTEINHHVELVVHVDECLDQFQLSDMEEAIRTTQGVARARYTKNRSHLMIVEYDPEVTSSLSVLTAICHQKVHAELIGPI